MDFVIQTEEQAISKGVFLEWPGLVHSIQQGLGAFIVSIFFIPAEIAMWIAFLDFFFHYLIDYMKVAFGTRDMQSKQYWINLGLDQFMHQLVYIFILQLVLGYKP